MKALILTVVLVSSILSAPAIVWFKSSTRKWDFQVRFGSDPPPVVASTDDQAQAILAQSMFPAQPPPPTAFDVIRQADAATHTPTAPLDRLRIAGVLHQAIQLTRETRIRSIDEWNSYTAKQLPLVLGDHYADWNPFLATVNNLASELNKQEKFQSMGDVANYFGGVESLLREGH